MNILGNVLYRSLCANCKYKYIKLLYMVQDYNKMYN